MNDRTSNDLSGMMWQDIDPLSTLQDLVVTIQPALSVDLDIIMIEGGNAST